MNKTPLRIAQTLTYAGILPFLGLSMAVVTKSTGYDYGFALRCYAAIIVSFLCGIHWATHLFFPNRCHRNQLVTSNAITLIAYTFLLSTSQSISLIIQSMCFIFLLLLDYELLKQTIIPYWYFNLRRTATLVVVTLLSAAALLS